MRMDGPGKAMNVSELFERTKIIFVIYIYIYIYIYIFFFFFFFFFVPVGQQPCLDFSGRQDSNHIRIPLFYCASRTTTMPGLFGPAGQQPYPDPVILLRQ